ncbi:uncharacterized protein LOC113924351 [Zalophus californianus]|uniref:Uncharacterized protein LOC113924351 n=1 Tax=Zalophus californianus TaxID=9704 RepID=A0A6J2DE24_ZALCA|nr:uncharacterized protein LOC113924351 [Zalophus californianus]
MRAGAGPLGRGSRRQVGRDRGASQTASALPHWAVDAGRAGPRRRAREPGRCARGAARGGFRARRPPRRRETKGSTAAAAGTETVGSQPALPTSVRTRLRKHQTVGLFAMRSCRH